MESKLHFITELKVQTSVRWESPLGDDVLYILYYLINNVESM